MNTTIKAEFNEWRGYTIAQIQQVGVDYNFKVNGNLIVENQDIYNFESAQTAPYWVIYRKTTFEEHGNKYYGTFAVIKNDTYADSVFSDCFSERTETPISVTTGQPSGQPTYIEWNGVNVFTSASLVYNISFYDSDTADAIKEDCRVNQTFATIGVSVLINNIPCFMADENNQLDITREDLYMGVAYQNGKFYGEPIELDNPYTDSEPDDDGGDGDADWSRHATPERSLPDNFYGECGLVTVYTPSSLQLKNFSNYIWSDNGLNLSDFKRIVNNPFDLVLGLNYIPFRVVTAGTKPVNVGNILSVTTNLEMDYPTQENYMFSFGEVSLGQQMNAFCDYSPHTRLSIHLPFIGTQALDVDIIRRGKYNPYNFTLKYKYNIVTGTVIAYLISDDGVIVYTWAGNVACPIPVASNDFTNTLNGMFGFASNAVAGAVTGGMVGGPAGAVAGAGLSALTGSASAMASLKPTITTSGGTGACASVLAPTNTAYFIIEQPQMQLDKQYKKYNGLPRNVSGTIKNNYGYNEIDGIRLEVNRATGQEKEEIVKILTSGYIYGNADGEVIPRPTIPDSDNVQFALYQTTSSNHRIDKKCTLLHNYADIVIKENTSITSPTIRLKATDTNVCIGNYGYIPKFHRYYYVEDVRSVCGDIWELDLRCDVLMSHKKDIIDQTAIFKRSQSHWNLYLNDDRIQIDSRPHIYNIPFPNVLPEDCTYVLLLAGGQ